MFNYKVFFRISVEIHPRLGAGAIAGFELGSGFFSNTNLPEGIYIIIFTKKI
jgi:hypothetical protein